MRSLLFSALFLGLVSSASAVDTGNRLIPPAKESTGDGMSDTREGGESYDDAYVIPPLSPGDSWSDSGATCDNQDDVIPSCAYSLAPDVVYVVTPAANVDVTIDLCGSEFDTVLEIQDGIGVPYACNDDYCDLQSGIQGLDLLAGHTYYIIVDGYGSSCGTFTLNISGSIP